METTPQTDKENPTRRFQAEEPHRRKEAENGNPNVYAAPEHSGAGVTPDDALLADTEEVEGVAWDATGDEGQKAGERPDKPSKVLPFRQH